MGGFKIPLDAMIVAVPTLYALCAMGGLVFKTLTTDPEFSTASYYERPEEELRNNGQKWNDGVRDLFKDRIARHQWGVFNNEYDAAK